MADEQVRTAPGPPNLFSRSGEALVEGLDPIPQNGDLGNGVGRATESARAIRSLGAPDKRLVFVLAQRHRAARAEYKGFRLEIRKRCRALPCSREAQGLGNLEDLTLQGPVATAGESVDALALGLIQTVGRGLLDVEPAAILSFGPDRHHLEPDVEVVFVGLTSVSRSPAWVGAAASAASDQMDSRNRILLSPGH